MGKRTDERRRVILFLLDEVQLLEAFVSVLNGLSDKKNCDVYVTGSNAKFLSRNIAIEFGAEVMRFTCIPFEVFRVYDHL